MASNTASISDLAIAISKCYARSPGPCDIAQIQHRLHLLQCWLGDHPGDAAKALESREVLEIGCGQGDMTVVLAHAVGNEGIIFATDPAPLDYGAPRTIGEAQNYIIGSAVGNPIGFVPADAMVFLDGYNSRPDYIVLAHSLFYLSSTEYTAALMRKLREHARAGTKLLVAEWGMSASDPAAEAHVLAVKAQIAHFKEDSNIRTVLHPDNIKDLTSSAGWTLQHETWIQRPQLDDGKWEYNIAQYLLKDDGITEEAVARIEEMNAAAKCHGGEVKSMDVWTSVWVAEEEDA